MQHEENSTLKQANWFDSLLGSICFQAKQLERKQRASAVRAAFENFVELANAAKAEELQVTLIDGDRIVSTNVESIKLDISFKY